MSKTSKGLVLGLTLIFAATGSSIALANTVSAGAGAGEGAAPSGWSQGEKTGWEGAEAPKGTLKKTTKRTTKKAKKAKKKAENTLQAAGQGAEKEAAKL